MLSDKRFAIGKPSLPLYKRGCFFCEDVSSGPTGEQTYVEVAFLVYRSSYSQINASP